MVPSELIMGIVLIILGVLKYMGKNFTKRELRKFQIYNVTEEDKILYSKQIGKGIIIFGITFIAGNYIFKLYNTTIGCVILFAGLITFIGMNVSAYQKYIRKIY